MVPMQPRQYHKNVQTLSVPNGSQAKHRAGANGDLVEGEEHLLKAIIKWDAIPNAERRYVIIATIALMKIQVLPMIL